MIKEQRVPNHPQIYRLVVVGKSRNENKGRFRVRKRIKACGKWTTRVQTFDSFEEAKRFSKTAHISVCSNSARSLVFESVFERFLEHKRTKERLSEGSLDGYRNRAKHLRFFDTLPMSQIDSRAVDAWLDLIFDPDYKRLQQKTRISYEHEYFLLSGVLSYFRNHEDVEFRFPLLERHRAVACKRDRSAEEREIRYLSQHEETSFLAALNSSTLRDIAFFQLHTGVRIGEAAALEFHNIDFHSDEVRVAQHLHWERKKGSRIELLSGTKGGPSRRVLLTTPCKAMLKQRKSSASSTKVFSDAAGNWLSYRTLQAGYDRAFVKLGLPHRGTHTLRHTFAVRFLEQTKDVHALQRLLGHADLKDTLRYAKYTNDSVRRSFQLFRGGLEGENEEARSTTGSTALTQNGNLLLV